MESQNTPGSFFIRAVQGFTEAMIKKTNMSGELQYFEVFIDSKIVQYKLLFISIIIFSYNQIVQGAICASYITWHYPLWTDKRGEQMLYKLIIADDEEKIRDGLTDLIPWEQPGFKVEKVCADGREVIDFVAENEVHAVLTDIKMVKATGIDVAKCICENKLPIKVVLISAYNDFSLAKEAIEYNVSNCIVKPTKLPDIRKIFKKVKEEIDATLADEYKKIELKETSDHIDMLLRRQFFSDIYYGAIKSREDIDKRFKLINLDFDPYNNLCSVFSIYTKDNIAKNSNIKDIRNLINSTRIAKVNSLSYTMNFYPLHQGSKKITYLAIKLSSAQEWNKETWLRPPISISTT